MSVNTVEAMLSRIYRKLGDPLAHPTQQGRCGSDTRTVKDSGHHYPEIIRVTGTPQHAQPRERSPTSVTSRRA